MLASSPAHRLSLAEQVASMKAKHAPHALMAVQTGDFVDIYGADAATAADVLKVVVGQRGSGADVIQACFTTRHRFPQWRQRLEAAGHDVELVIIPPAVGAPEFASDAKLVDPSELTPAEVEALATAIARVEQVQALAAACRAILARHVGEAASLILPAHVTDMDSENVRAVSLVCAALPGDTLDRDVFDRDARADLHAALWPV